MIALNLPAFLDIHSNEVWVELTTLLIHTVRLFVMKLGWVRIVNTFTNDIWHWPQHAMPCTQCFSQVFRCMRFYV